MNRLTQKKQKARNFARAFLRTHTISQEELFAGIDVLLERCINSSLVFHTLELSSAVMAEKYAAIDDLVERLALPNQFAFLLRAVLRYKEFNLLATILRFLKQEFCCMNSIHEVLITSSHALEESAKQNLESLIHDKVPGTLRFMYKQDASLIAGVRITTPLYYWEHSVARTIRTLQQQLRAQE
jgi:F0F1-type ATP synthase delta subunit